jgi:hypothetical protein
VLALSLRVGTPPRACNLGDTPAQGARLGFKQSLVGERQHPALLGPQPARKGPTFALQARPRCGLQLLYASLQARHPRRSPSHLQDKRLPLRACGGEGDASRRREGFVGMDFRECLFHELR